MIVKKKKYDYDKKNAESRILIQRVRDKVFEFEKNYDKKDINTQIVNTYIKDIKKLLYLLEGKADHCRGVTNHEYKFLKERIIKISR